MNNKLKIEDDYFNDKKIDVSTQTDSIASDKEIIDKLQKENETLMRNFRDVVKLLSLLCKTHIDVDNFELDKIRNHVTILMNRELRMRFPFPFVDILSRYNHH